MLYVDGEDAGVMRVSSDRRVTEPVTVLDTAHGETNHLWPEALPNGKGILVTVAHGSSLAEMDIAVVDFATGTSVTTRFLSAIDLHFRDRGQRNSE